MQVPKTMETSRPRNNKENVNHGIKPGIIHRNNFIQEALSILCIIRDDSRSPSRNTLHKKLKQIFFAIFSSLSFPKIHYASLSLFLTCCNLYNFCDFNYDLFTHLLIIVTEISFYIISGIIFTIFRLSFAI